MLMSFMDLSFHQDIHKELEEKISRFHGHDDTILYASCFDANAGIFESLLTPDDAVISDELNHASIIDGIRLCKAQRHRYKHMNMEGKSEGICDKTSRNNIHTFCLFLNDKDVCIINLRDN